MMEPEDTDIQRLIRLKRYEQPPEGFVDDFVVNFQYRQRSELLRESSFSIFWDRLTAFLDGRSTQVAGAAFAAVALVGLGSMALIAPHNKSDAPSVAVTEPISPQVTTRSPSFVAQGGAPPLPPLARDPITVPTAPSDFSAIPQLSFEAPADTAKDLKLADLGDLLLSKHFDGGITADSRKGTDGSDLLLPVGELHTQSPRHSPTPAVEFRMNGQR